MDAKKVRRRRTIIVGAFVAGVGVLLLIVVLWLAGSRFLRPVDRYEVIFKGSVSGLLPGAAVELNGVSVGKVADIRLTRDSPPRVAVDVEVRPGTPVRKDSVANLTGSLVTGIRFIEISGGSEKAGVLGQDEPIPVDESSFDDIRRQATDLSLQVHELLVSLNQGVLNKSNRESFGRLLEETSEAAHNMKVVTAGFATPENMKSLSTSLSNLAQASDKLNQAVSTFAMHKDDIYRGLDSALVRLNKTLEGTQRVVLAADSVLDRSSGQLALTLQELHRTSRHLNETIQNIEADPSVLVWGTKPSERDITR